MDLELQFTKWGGRPHWRYGLDRLGSDRFGLWLAGRAGLSMQRGAELPVTHVDDFVVLVPSDGSWIAHWNALDALEIYVDVTTRPVLHDHVVSAVDVDLDVVRWRDDQRVELLDEDEFELHQVELCYPRSLIEATRATTAWLLNAVALRVEPFGRVGQSWLSRLGGDAAQ
jgi:predicted RNA-binding protein associated with RNAse of E/G family